MINNFLEKHAVIIYKHQKFLHPFCPLNKLLNSFFLSNLLTLPEQSPLDLLIIES